jgi:NADP-dependent aldehyde dehydrogenase
MYTDTAIDEIDILVRRSKKAFQQYRLMPLTARAGLMRAIASELEKTGDELISIAMKETNLPEARLKNERIRTMFQLTSYADACEKGNWLDIRIDTADPQRTPPKPDIRKMMVPLGPVVVYGASNFPFAYSTAGGDTASAFAAGCSVIVKAHPAHPETSTRVTQAIQAAISRCGLPEDLFIHVFGASPETGKVLVTHPDTKAVGFTGSFTAGKALFDWANQRSEPIPVFAEMGSVNPVFLLPEKLKTSAHEMAQQYAGSITLGAGQFCTNPGLIIGVNSPELEDFISALGNAMSQVPPATMLHEGIAKAYQQKKSLALAQAGTSLLSSAQFETDSQKAVPAVAAVEGTTFLSNPLLHQEVFGPYSLVIRCSDAAQMLDVAKHLEGQLTATLMATETDMRNHAELVKAAEDICGRLIMNGVPTGVEVCLAMHHGGPFPATTDARFSSVGADAIKRFARPVAYQNWPDSLLPEELKNENPLSIWRTVNNELTNKALSE